MHQDPDEHDHRAGHGQHPADDRLAVEEQEPDSDDQREQRQAEGVVAPQVPEPAGDRYLVGEEIRAGDGHDEAGDERADAALGSACALEVAHAVACLMLYFRSTLITPSSPARDRVTRSRCLRSAISTTSSTVARP